MDVERTALSDEQLLELFRQGDSSAVSELADRYSAIIKKCRRENYLMGLEIDDLIQEGMVGLITAMQSYNSALGVPFRAYATLCINNKVKDAVRGSRRLKHTPINRGLPLEDMESGEDSAKPAAELQHSPSPEELLIEREQREQLYALADKLLSPLEQKVMACYLEGMSYREIALHCGKSAKSVDSALQRIRKKLSDAMDGK